MTYCVGLLLNEGMVLLSDTRTNAGLDNISTYRKMFTFEEPGERVITIMTAGSLSVTQTTIAQLREDIADREATPETSIMLAPTMLKVAEIVGNRLPSGAVPCRTPLDFLVPSSATASPSCGPRWTTSSPSRRVPRPR